jgi:hypothetical protein
MNLSGKKTLKNKFQWTPKHLGYEKGSRPIPPLKIDSRLPKLWITSLPPEEKELKTGKDLVTDIYFVNSSGIVLDSVIANTGGPARGYADDPEFLEAFHRSGEVIEYTNVANGEAVRIFEYEQIYDSDWILSIGFEVKMNDKFVKLNSSCSKVTIGFQEEALLY